MKTLLTLCVAVLLVGCGDYIKPRNYEQSVEICEPNGGLKAVYKWILSYRTKAECNNGVEATFIPPQPRK